MRTRLAGLVLLGMALASGGLAAGGDAQAERKKFEGTWTVESVREVGKDVREEFKDTTFTFAGDKITIRKGGEGEEGTFRIDPGKTPRQIDVIFEGKTVDGIYAFEGGKLKLCTAKKGERPTEFKSAAGSKTALFVLKRVKK
jgi:uncharacterized protein (TIGR03067 family)